MIKFDLLIENGFLKVSRVIVTQSSGVIVSAPKSRTSQMENSHILSIC